MSPIFRAKDGHMDYMRRRPAANGYGCIRNVHPCIYFFVAMFRLAALGRKERVIFFFADRYCERCPTVCPEFLRVARADSSRQLA